MEKISIEEIMERAYSRHIVVPAFNVPYLPMIEPIVNTLKNLECFGLIEVARPDVEKFEAKNFSAVAGEFFKFSDSGYTRLHQDHIPVIDEDGQRVEWKALIEEALKAGFHSVMIDGSRLPLEENIRVTKTVVEMAHKKGIPVEGELGAVLGHESGPLPPYEELFSSGKGFTDPDEAVRFVKETGVDWLSVAIGNIHGAISGAAKNQKKLEARLNINHLKKLSKATRIPLVLHGGSGVKQDSVLRAIQNGIAKVNVGTVLRQVYEAKLKEEGEVKASQEAVRKEVENLIRNYYRIEGSAGLLCSYYD